MLRRRSAAFPSVLALALASALPAALPPRAARAEIEHHAQQWTLLMAQREIAGGTRAYLEVQPRTDLNDGRLDRLLLRPAIFRPVAEGLTLWLGYAAIGAFSPATVWEHRFWQQLQHELVLPALTLVNRARLEERLLPGVGPVGGRIRHLLRATVPLDEKRIWAAVMYDEIFFNLNSPGGGVEAGFDQNRAFAGVSWTASEWLRLEGGYMNNFVHRAAPAPDRMNHIPYLLASASL